MDLHLTGASISHLTHFIVALIITFTFLSLKGNAPPDSEGHTRVTKPTRLLAGFIAGMAGYALVSLIESTIGISWRLHFLILEPVPVLFGLIFLLQFAYSFPSRLPQQEREAKFLFIFSLLAALFGLAKAIYRWYNFHFYLLEGTNSNLELILITILFLWCIVVLCRRTIIFQERKSQQRGPIGYVKALIYSKGKAAKATRAFALTLTAPLWITVILLIGEYGSLFYVELLLEWLTGFSWEGYLHFVILFFGLLVFLLSFLITYLNHSPDSSSFMVKLVGISLGTLLMVLGMVGLSLALLHQSTYENEYLMPLGTIHFEPIPSGGYHISKRPLQFDEELGELLDLDGDENARVEFGFGFPFYDETWHEGYIQEDGAIAFGAALNPDIFRFRPYLLPTIAPLYAKLNARHSLKSGIFSKEEPGRLTITWYNVKENNVAQNITNTFQLVLYASGAFDISYQKINIEQIYLNDHHRRAHLVGVFSAKENSLPERIRFAEQLPVSALQPGGVIEDYYLDFRQDLHQQLLPVAYLIVAGSFFILLGFPRFFQTTLVKPLDGLVSGMKEVNQGNLDLKLEVQYNDEIGSMTQSFNGMVESLRHSEQLKDELNAALKKSNEELEGRVIERTTELLKAKEEAEAANQAKSDFLSNMSHELRTPLNGILGYAQILKSSTLSPSEKRGIEIIHQSGHHLLTLINDILDLSKIEARKMELYPQDLHLESFLTGVVGIIGMRAQDADVLFVYERDETLPRAIKGDEKRLRQVLLNLLGNAVKFTQRGQVTLNVERQGDFDESNNHATLRFEIIDTGVGMTSEQLETIFLPFEQVGDAKQRAKGTGLGLAITQQLVKLMGGEVFVESELGKGSRFWFDLSFPVVEQAETGEQVDEQRGITGYKGKPLKVLVVDDKAENRYVLRDLLTPLGFEIEEAENGLQAVELTRSQQPDLLLTDLVMPVMDGFKAVKAIRQFDKEVPIIAISASVWEAEQLNSLKYGCNAFLPKPVDRQKLLALIEKHAQVAWIYEPSTTDALPSSEQALIPPPQSALETLYEAAMMGMMSQIRQQMDELEQTDGKYAPFASKVRELARGFEDEKIVALVEGYLGTT